MISAFISAFGQLGDPRIRRVIVWVTLWTTVAFGAVGSVLWLAIASIDIDIALAFIPFEWLRELLAWLAGLLFVAFGWFVFFALFWMLFVAIVHVVSGLYIERVIAAVEARHYPDLPAARPLKMAASMDVAMRFLGALLIINLLALPIYLIPVVGVVAFYLVNGYLLGREYFELVAIRRLEPRQIDALRGVNRVRLLATGLIIALFLTLPVINLVVPIVAAAAMVHIYQAMPAATAQTALAE